MSAASPIEGRLLDHNGLFYRSDAIDLMVELLGDDVVEAENHEKKTNDAHARFCWLRENFKKRLQEAAEAQEDGDVAEMRLKRD